MKFAREFYGAVATLTGCIIGAGVLGIPFVVVKAGFWTGLLVILVLGLAALVIHLLIGEISLRSSKCHQLTGYAEKYLGSRGKFLMLISMVVGVYGALVAYTIGIGESLVAIFGGSFVFWAVLFYVIMAFLLLGGLSVLVRSELALEVFKFGIFGAILFVLFSSDWFSLSNHVGFSWSNLLVPYGAVLFAYIGTAAIPEVREELNKCKLLTRKAIIVGSLVPIIVYALFAFAVVGVSGFSTTEVATIGLADLVGGVGFGLLHLFAVLAMASSFVALGFALLDSYRLDFGVSRPVSWLLVLIVPVLILSFGVGSFVRTLEVAGTFAGGIAGITIVCMHIVSRRRSERKPEFKVNIGWLGYSLLIGLFVVGMLYELYLIFV